MGKNIWYVASRPPLRRRRSSREERGDTLRALYILTRICVHLGFAEGYPEHDWSRPALQASPPVPGSGIDHANARPPPLRGEDSRRFLVGSRAVARAYRAGRPLVLTRSAIRECQDIVSINDLLFFD